MSSISAVIMVLLHIVYIAPIANSSASPFHIWDINIGDDGSLQLSLASQNQDQDQVSGITTSNNDNYNMWDQLMQVNDDDGSGPQDRPQVVADNEGKATEEELYWDPTSNSQRLMETIKAELDQRELRPERQMREETKSSLRGSRQMEQTEKGNAKSGRSLAVVDGAELKNEAGQQNLPERIDWDENLHEDRTDRSRQEAIERRALTRRISQNGRRGERQKAKGTQCQAGGKDQKHTPPDRDEKEKSGKCGESKEDNDDDDDEDDEDQDDDDNGDGDDDDEDEPEDGEAEEEDDDEDEAEAETETKSNGKSTCQNRKESPKQIKYRVELKETEDLPDDEHQEKDLKSAVAASDEDSYDDEEEVPDDEPDQDCKDEEEEAKKNTKEKSNKGIQCPVDEDASSAKEKAKMLLIKTINTEIQQLEAIKNRTLHDLGADDDCNEAELVGSIRTTTPFSEPVEQELVDMALRKEKQQSEALLAATLAAKTAMTSAAKAAGATTTTSLDSSTNFGATALDPASKWGSYPSTPTWGTTSSGTTAFGASPLGATSFATPSTSAPPTLTVPSYPNLTSPPLPPGTPLTTTTAAGDPNADATSKHQCAKLRNGKKGVGIFDGMLRLSVNKTRAATNNAMPSSKREGKSSPPVIVSQPKQVGVPLVEAAARDAEITERSDLDELHPGPSIEAAGVRYPAKVGVGATQSLKGPMEGPIKGPKEGPMEGSPDSRLHSSDKRTMVVVKDPEEERRREQAESIRVRGTNTTLKDVLDVAVWLELPLIKHLAIEDMHRSSTEDADYLDELEAESTATTEPPPSMSEPASMPMSASQLTSEPNQTRMLSIIRKLMKKRDEAT